MNEPYEPVTDLLSRWSAGEESARDAVLPLIYDELKALAKARLRAERPGHTLQPTALVHELYLKLQQQGRIHWQSRNHFLSLAARLMRRILVDHFREKGAVKRGRGYQRVPIEEVVLEVDSGTDLLAIDEALDKLAELDPRPAQIVELRFFGGMTVSETAEALSISEPTVKRDWAFARSWLWEELRAR